MESSSSGIGSPSLDENIWGHCYLDRMILNSDSISSWRLFLEYQEGLEVCSPLDMIWKSWWCLLSWGSQGPLEIVLCADIPWVLQLQLWPWNPKIVAWSKLSPIIPWISFLPNWHCFGSCPWIGRLFAKLLSGLPSYQRDEAMENSLKWNRGKHIWSWMNSKPLQKD